MTNKYSNLFLNSNKNTFSQVKFFIAWFDSLNLSVIFQLLQIDRGKAQYLRLHKEFGRKTRRGGFQNVADCNFQTKHW